MGQKGCGNRESTTGLSPGLGKEGFIFYREKARKNRVWGRRIKVSGGQTGGSVG